MFPEISLDIRTLNFITILFSFIYCAGFILYQHSQGYILGLTSFSLSILTIGLGPLFLSLRGVAPDWVTIVLANLFIVLGFQLALYSLTLFRNSHLVYAWISAAAMPIFLSLILYYTYFNPSINARVVVISLFLSYITFCSAWVVLKGKNADLKIAVNMLASAFLLFSFYLFYRAIWSLFSVELSDFMSAGVVHQLSFLFGIILIVSMSFSMLWMINARLFDEVRQLSIKDSQTQLYNRRALDNIAQKTLQQASKDGTSLSVIMSDIDSFKQINDQHGHIVGDKVIEKVAEKLLAKLYGEANAFRYGGDEILLLLPNTDCKEALDLAEQLRQSVANELCHTQPDINCTSSFGVAEYQYGESWNEFLARADMALYLAKENGRNVVMSS